MVLTKDFVDQTLDMSDQYVPMKYDRQSRFVPVLPENTIRIDNGAFEDCDKMQSIRLDSSTKEIGQGAFRNCIELSSIDLSKVERIEPCAFQDCQKLSACNLDNLKSIGYSAFDGSGDSNLSVHMPLIEEFSSNGEIGSLTGFMFSALIMDKIQAVPNIQQPDIDWLSPSSLNAKIYVQADMRDKMLAYSTWNQLADQIEAL